MSLRLPDKWLWDFWFAQDGPDYHIFYLQASRTLPDPELRHWNVSIGHAVSQDLRNWQVLPDALHPSPQPAWDDKSTWTGSIINQNGLWHMLYTGTSHAENGYVQRIGLATSLDLVRWEKHSDNPVLEIDPRWYELPDLETWGDQSWRDPWLFKHPGIGDFHAFITARVKTGPVDGRGVIAHARSNDLSRWEILPPVCEAGHFGTMEVPQMVEINGRYYLLFSTLVHTTAIAHTRRIGLSPVTGTHYLVADNPLGPFRFLRDEFLVGDEVGSLFAGKLIQAPGGQWVFLAWRYFSPKREFIGELSDPFPVTIDQNKNLSVNLYSVA